MNTYFIYLILNILVCITCFFFGKESVQHWLSQNTIISREAIPSRPQIVENRQFIMADEIWANPESTLLARESFQKNPYRISEWPGGENNEVLVYLPTFFEQPLEKQVAFWEKIRILKSYTLVVEIYTYSQFEKSKIVQLYSVLPPQFSSVTFRIYNIPVNYYDIISGFPFNLAGKDIILEFYGKMFPDGFYMDSVVLHIKNMLQKNLRLWDRIHSVIFSHEEAWNIYFVLSDESIKNLLDIPTKTTFTERILIDSTPHWFGESLKWEKKIEQFFKNSTIQDIQMQSVWEKKNWIISLYWF